MRFESASIPRHDRTFACYVYPSLCIFLFASIAILTLLITGRERLSRAENILSNYHLQSSLHVSRLRKELDNIEHLFITPHTLGETPQDSEFLQNKFARCASIMQEELAILNSIQDTFDHPDPGSALTRLTLVINQFINTHPATFSSDKPLIDQFHPTYHILKARIDQFEQFHYNSFRETDLPALRAAFWHRFNQFTIIVGGGGLLVITILLTLMQRLMKTRRLARQQLQERESVFNSLFSEVPSGILLVDANLHCLRCNSFLVDLCQRSSSEIIGRTPRDIFASDVTELERAMRHTMATGEPHLNLEMQAQSRRQDNEAMHLLASVFSFSPLVGAPEVIGCIFLDITERKQAELSQKLMMDELDHRVKNNLSAIISLAKQSSQHCHSYDDFETAFFGRLTAMARSHEALARSKWKSIDFGQAASQVLKVYLDEVPSRVTLRGEGINLPANAALPVCLTLHELATNSSKHGALSNAEGTIELSWVRHDNDLHILWTESGGPPIIEPVIPGTGTNLIKGLIEFELKGCVEMNFMDGLFECSIRIPHSQPSIAHAIASKQPALT